MLDFTRIDNKINELEQCLAKSKKVSATEPLLVGVDLGTAYIVVVVLDAKLKPVACVMQFAQVVKDGLVVDYTGAVDIVRNLVHKLEKKLGRSLEYAATAVPPGTSMRDSATHAHIIEGAGLDVIHILDEPTAANAVLQVQNGVIVDIGGGTTGLSIIKDGKVIAVADEPTGGTHLSLVLAGNYNISFDEAENLKKDNSKHKEFLPVVRPVLQKMASIITAHTKEYNVENLYLVGGTCCLQGMEKVIAAETGKKVYTPVNPFLVTPLGIAMNCLKRA